MRTQFLPRFAPRLLVVAAVCAGTGLAMAGSGMAFEIHRSSIDGGGDRSEGGIYTLTGSIGQPDAGALAGADYLLAGGFWAGTGGTQDGAGVLFADGFESTGGMP